MGTIQDNTTKHESGGCLFALNLEKAGFMTWGRSLLGIPTVDKLFGCEDPGSNCYHT